MPKDTLIKKFAKIIEDHNQQTQYEDLHKRNPNYMQSVTVPHFLSNELDVAEVQHYLAKLPTRLTPNELQIGILTGEAYCLSRLPELAKHVDIVLIADLQSMIHRHVEYMLKCMKAAPNREAFMLAYLSDDNPIIKQRYPSMPLRTLDGESITSTTISEVVDKTILEMMLRAGTAGLQDLHFLSSEQRYQQCYAACQTLPVWNLTWDWTNPSSAKKLMEQLDGLPVKFEFCHVSNVDDYDGNIPLRSIFEKLQLWKPNGNVARVLVQLFQNQPQPIINLSYCLAKTEFKHLHSKIALSMKDFTQQCIARATAAHDELLRQAKALQQKQASTQSTPDATTVQPPPQAQQQPAVHAQPAPPIQSQPQQNEYSAIIDQLKTILTADESIPKLNWTITTLNNQSPQLQTVETFRNRDVAVKIARMMKAGGFELTKLMREEATTGPSYRIIIVDIRQYIKQPDPKQPGAPANSKSSSEN